jgi:hypothetical protein
MDGLTSGLWHWRGPMGVPRLYFIDKLDSYLHAMNATQTVIECLVLPSWPHCDPSMCEKPCETSIARYAHMTIR